MEISQIMKHQPTINIGMIGSVSNGKSTITGKLTGIKTQKHSDELKKNITIKLGYANTKIFKCPDCPEPQCYQSHHSEIMEAQCKFCDNELVLEKHISIVDCFDPTTKVLMHDGSTKKVSELKLKDHLMGPDGKKREILKFMKGKKDLYEIKYGAISKNSLDNDKFICTGGHLLVLRIDTPIDPPANLKHKYLVRVYESNNNSLYTKCYYFKTLDEAKHFYDSQNKEPKIFEMTVEAFLNAPVTLKKRARLFHSECLEFSSDNHDILDISIPGATNEEIGWLIGLWLGDGTTSHPQFSIGHADPEIMEKLKIISAKIGLIPVVYEEKNNKKAYRVKLSTCSGKAMYTVSACNENNKNCFSLLLQKLGIFNNKEINNNLKFQNKSIREAIVAGLIDSDGCYYKGQFEIGQSIGHNSIMDGLIWIIRSLGFVCRRKKSWSKTTDNDGNIKKHQQNKIKFNGKSSNLPICTPRKQGKDIVRGWALSQPFDILKMSEGEYIGFEIDGDGKFLGEDFIVLHNCPGHHLLMSTMLNGTCVMDTTILVESGLNSIPASQTLEHLMATNMIGLKNTVTCINKFDLVKKDDAQDKINSMKTHFKGTMAETSPIIPISANYGLNIDVLCEYICKLIPEPERNLTDNLKMIIIRSFNVNKQDVDISELQGGVIGGTITQGTLKKNDKVSIYPGIISEYGKDNISWYYKPLVGTVQSINSESNDLEYAIPGGLIGVKLDIDPGFASKDGLVGNILTNFGNNGYKIYETVFVEINLIRTSKIVNDDNLIINYNACNEKCKVVKIKHDKAELKLLEKPICVNLGDYITLSRIQNNSIMIVGRAKIVHGVESMLR